MKLRSIRLENVRRFDAPVQLDGIGDGLNVLSEPNEHGKSTLFDALQALFLRPHGSKAEDIRALRPHSGGAPEVAVEIETGEGRFTLSKRWWSKPFARVEQAGRLIAQADEAEDWIGRLMGGDGDGPSGLLWVRQGMTGLTDGSKKEQVAALAARRDLLSSVTGEVEAMTGGRRMDAALARCAEDLAEYCTGTGRPRTGGPWKQAQERAAALAAEELELEDTARALHEALTERKRKRRDLAEIEDPEAAEARARRLEDAETAFHAAERHAERVEAERRRVEAAEGKVRDAKARLDALRSALAEHADASKAAEATAQAQDTARAASAEADAALDAARRQLSGSGDALAAAEAAHGAALRRQAARDGAARRADLAARLEAAETARAAMEEAAAVAAHGPDAEALRRLEELDAAARTARALHDTAAPHIVMHYAAGRDGTVTHDGTPLPQAEAVPVPEGVELDLHGLGRLTVRPGAGPQAADDAEAAARALCAALEGTGAATLAEAREAGARRADAEKRAAEARVQAQTAAPQGIDALRAALAAIPEAAADDGGESPDPADTEAAVAHARTARAAAEARRDVAEADASEARSRAARAEAAAEAAAARLRRAETALDRLEERDEARLSDALAQATTSLTAARAVFEEAAREAPDLAAAGAALGRARSVMEQARQTAARLRPEIAALDERIARSSGEAVDERLAETREARAAADARLARIERDVAVLQRLEAALQGARSEARERYFEPVAHELRPLLNLLWPEAELVWGDDTLLPRALVRDGRDEPIEILSGGTQEQVALLVRLAFARMLAKRGRHAPVILDDALVFTDDDRIERMFDALHRQAGDLQILVLSCRQRAFRDLGGRLLRLAHGQGAESAA